MKWFTRSIVPTMAAFAALVAFFPSHGPSITLSATDFAFTPGRLVVRLGDSIAIHDNGRQTHTFTCKPCGLDSGNIQPGQDKVVRFARAGQFSFVCIYHQNQGMIGSVVVLRPGEAVPSPSAPAPS